jgi:hypothetical protein
MKKLSKFIVGFYVMLGVFCGLSVVYGEDSVNSEKIIWGQSHKYIDNGLGYKLASIDNKIFSAHFYDDENWLMIGKPKYDNIIEWHNTGTYDKSAYTTINALASLGDKLIEVHCHSNSASQFLYKVGTYDGNNVQWGPSVDLQPKGRRISAMTSINNKIVGINGGDYFLGSLNENNTIDWSQYDTEFAQFDEGLSSITAIGDKNKVIAVVANHNDSHKHLFYNIGTLKGNHIEWNKNGYISIPAAPYAWSPSITYDSKKKQLVVVYDEGEEQEGVFQTKDSLICISGKLNSDDTVTWSEGEYIGTGSNPNITFADGKIVLNFSTIDLGNNVFYRIGRIKGSISSYKKVKVINNTNTQLRVEVKIKPAKEV